MIIPNCVLETVKKMPLDNHYFYHAEDAWERATDIYNGQIKFYSDDISLLINTLERYYKAFLQAKKDEDPSYLQYPGFLTSDHDLNKLVVEIERFVPLTKCETRQDYKERREFFDNLRREYTTTRYTARPDFNEYKQLYQFVSKQRDIVIEYFQEKNKQIEEPDLDL